jgi:hypothetical protein
MKNSLISCFKPFFDYIDNGKFFRKPYAWFYVLIAVLNLLFPFYILGKVIANRFFSFAEGSLIAVFIIFWLILAFAAWFSFQLWWNRKKKVETLTKENDDFVAIPVFSNLIQTTGEWCGTYIAIVGCLGSILASIFLGESVCFFNSFYGFGIIDFTTAGIVLMPLYGFIIIGVSRFFAEGARALASIANNTKKKG